MNSSNDKKVNVEQFDSLRHNCTDWCMFIINTIHLWATKCENIDVRCKLSASEEAFILKVHGIDTNGRIRIKLAHHCCHHLGFFWKFACWYTSRCMAKIDFWKKFKIQDGGPTDAQGAIVQSSIAQPFLIRFRWSRYRCKGNLVNSPIKCMNVGVNEEEVHQNRSSNFFEAIFQHFLRGFFHFST